MRALPNVVLKWLMLNFLHVLFTQGNSELLYQTKEDSRKNISSSAEPYSYRKGVQSANSSLNYITVYTKQNDDLLLRCSLNGKTHSHIWWKNGEKISGILKKNSREKLNRDNRYMMEINGDLFIKNVKLEDSGSWQCQAKNPHGMISDGVILNVIILDPPNKIYLMIDNRILDPGNPFLPVKENTDISISCVVDDGNPRPTLTWDLIPGLTVSTDVLEEPFDLLNLTETTVEQIMGARSDVTLRKIQRTHHNATLTCYVHHIALDRPLNISVLLNVQYSPSFAITREPGFGLPIKEGMTVSLKCDVDANPRAQPVWKKDEEDPPIQQIDGFLNFSEIRREHSGWYKCVTSHMLGKFSSIGYFLNVRYDSESTQEPDFDIAELTSTGQQLQVSVGETVHLTCPTGITGCWARLRQGVNKFEPLGASKELKLDTVLYQEAGKYLCLNPKGSEQNKLEALKKSLSFELVVTGQPTVHPIYKNVTAVYAQPLTLTVEFCANPLFSNVMWLTSKKVYMPGDGDKDIVAYDITDSSISHCHQAALFLTTVKSAHIGEYIFVVRSPRGLAQGVFNISLIYSEKEVFEYTESACVRCRVDIYLFLVYILYVLLY